MVQKMTRDEFQKMVDDAAGYQCKKTDGVVTALKIEWSVGGQSGGSCWDEGDSTYHGTSGEAEPEFEDLDSILLAVAPQLSFLHYKKLMQKIETDDYRQNDYYGNYTDYATKTITVDDIWVFLIEYDMIEQA